MNTQELNTFKNFINSNNIFLNAIDSDTPYIPDIYLKVELLIIYIKSKYQVLPNLKDKYSTIYYLLNNNFYIEDEHIVINDHHYTIEELSAIIQTIDFSKENKISMISHNDDHSKTYIPSTCHVINITDFIHFQEFTMNERGIIFDRTCSVNSDTIPYIYEMRTRFNELLSHLIISILTNSISPSEENYYRLLGAYLKLYPFAGYAGSKIDIPYQDIVLPLNEIGLSKVKYQDKHLAYLKSRITELNRHIKKYVCDTETIITSGFITNKEAIDRRNRRVIALNSEVSELVFEYNNYSHNPEVLNTIFFKYIFEAFNSGNVIINRYFADPVIKFFTIDRREVTSYIAIHLTTLLNIIDPDILSKKSIMKKEFTV